MANPEKELSPSDYSNYRNIRAISVLYILLSFIGIICGIQIALRTPKTVELWDLPVAAGIAITLACIGGFAAGIATLQGSRPWARLTYVMSVLYLFAIPVGTILGAVMLLGLSGYLDSMDRLKRVDERRRNPVDSE